MITTGNFGIGMLWLSVTFVQHVVFKVRACANVHIRLAMYLGISDYDSYEVIIGANYDGITKILNITDGRYIGGFTFSDVICFIYLVYARCWIVCTTATMYWRKCLRCHYLNVCSFLNCA